MNKSINLIETNNNTIFEISNEDYEFLKSLEGKKFIVEDGDEVLFSFDEN